jgi:two-component system response regulator MprA
MGPVAPSSAPSSTARLLLADADPRRRELLQKHLRALGYVLLLEEDGVQAQHLLLSTPPELAILDASLPLYSGLELCHRLRDNGSRLPLFVLASTDRYSERVAALDAGADDVLSYPFALEEFTARVGALLRRSRMGISDADGNTLSHRDLMVNTAEREVIRAGLTLKLTVKEYDLLLYLLRHKEQVLTRHQILTAVWGDTWVGDDNLLDVYMRYLRKKIEKPDLETLIHTVRGVGFKLA